MIKCLHAPQEIDWKNVLEMKYLKQVNQFYLYKSKMLGINTDSSHIAFTSLQL